MIKDYEKKYENNKLSLHISNSGTVFDRDIPCLKACFYFDPKHTLENVVDSVSCSHFVSSTLLQIQNEKSRLKWDSFIESAVILEQSATERMQVVHTKFKKVTSLDQREFVEKKLYFCHTEDP